VTDASTVIFCLLGVVLLGGMFKLFFLDTRSKPARKAGAVLRIEADPAKLREFMARPEVREALKRLSEP
jgi:hypothetical protein